MKNGQAQKKQHRIHSHSSVKTRFLDTSFFLDGYRYIGYRIIPISKSSHRKSNQKSRPEKRKKKRYSEKGLRKKKVSARKLHVRVIRVSTVLYIKNWISLKFQHLATPARDIFLWKRTSLCTPKWRFLNQYMSSGNVLSFRLTISLYAIEWYPYLRAITKNRFGKAARLRDSLLPSQNRSPPRCNKPALISHFRFHFRLTFWL